MNKMTDTRATKYGRKLPKAPQASPLTYTAWLYGRKLPKAPQASPLTYTAWLYVVQVSKDAATFVRSKEDRGAYELARLKQGKFPRYYTLPMAALKLRQDGPSGAVLMEMPLALALDKRLVRHSFSNRE